MRSFMDEDSLGYANDGLKIYDKVFCGVRSVDILD